MTSLVIIMSALIRKTSQESETEDVVVVIVDLVGDIRYILYQNYVINLL